LRGGLGITGYLSTFAAVEEFALQNFPQTRAKLDSFKATLVPRALLQIFITNTFNQRLLGFV
jgi:hypothetical protein